MSIISLSHLLEVAETFQLLAIVLTNYRQNPLFHIA